MAELIKLIICADRDINKNFKYRDFTVISYHMSFVVVLPLLEVRTKTELKVRYAENIAVCFMSASARISINVNDLIST